MDTSKLIIASLKAGKEMKMSQRDWLVVNQYAENIGLKLEIVNKEKLILTVKAK